MTLDKLIRYEQQLFEDKCLDKLDIAREIYNILPSYNSMTTHPAYVRQMQVKHDFVIQEVKNGHKLGNINKQELYKRFIEYARGR